MRPIKQVTPLNQWAMSPGNIHHSASTQKSTALAFEEIFQPLIELIVHHKQYCYSLLYVPVHPNSLLVNSQHDAVEIVWALESGW